MRSKKANCTYYGNLDGKLHGTGVGIMLVDEAFKRILEKHENQLVKTQGKLIADLRKAFSEETKDMMKTVQALSKRVKELEMRGY